MGWFIAVGVVLLVIVLALLSRRRPDTLPWANRREQATYARGDQPGYNSLPPDGMG